MPIDESNSISARLWMIKCKLYGVGELIKFSNGEPALNQDECNLGIGEVLTDLAAQIDEIRDELEARSYEPTRECPENWNGRDDDSKVGEDENSVGAAAPTLSEKRRKRDSKRSKK